MGKARKHFEQWYRTKERGIAAGLQDMRLIASAAFNEGVRFAKEPCNTRMQMDGLRECQYQKTTYCKTDGTCHGCAIFAAHH